MTLSFKSFHPLSGVLPDTFPEFGGDIVFRARAILQSRTDEELFAALEIIDWIIDQSPAQDEVAAELERMAAEENNDSSASGEEPYSDSPIKRDKHSSTYALKALQPKFDISADEKFPNATWGEMFSVLALSLVAQACEDERLVNNKPQSENSERNDWLNEYQAVSRASYWLIEAMDAVATAEGINLFQSEIANEKQKISVRNRFSGQKKHKPTNDALLALRDFYIPEKHKSMRNAAKLFCEAYPEKVAHLTYYNRIRTLSEGLSALLKERRLSLQK
ncbi:hypothetical protein SAMN05216386_1000 [Nitrosospira briensis]|uniref:Uncharacterized protein n=1 Tax=Nitrosospira briensis TaxID=35799 RepID=A0A1I4Z2T6_9PROT|nr:hypothetical protein [Nitrosospira briensis]SFN44581.1 hypothetical protein SAMN05216386_1000 [Nitrosospira briensis]